MTGQVWLSVELNPLILIDFSVKKHPESHPLKFDTNMPGVRTSVFQTEYENPNPLLKIGDAFGFFEDELFIRDIAHCENKLTAVHKL